MADNNTGNQGFTSMDENQQREIASLGGKQSGGNFQQDRQKASRAGKKGGQKSNTNL